ncbi:hypothetical protein BCR34DRAFT_554105 [Clohesyomyces aquaticus]|uniref:Uncharacterized protein n=1 Tax=Clohesyomyces aquaticus TaxID=1231657 RepID=A0A1Y2A7S0_9PLEO|nr:hypothetical protein BCR34DRAFT_554105 [Clohesyomyces aquaticus]
MKFTTVFLIFFSTTMASPSSPPSHISGRDESISHTFINVHKRGCAVRDYGCEDGYCWRKCNPDTGGWCWLAYNGGIGAWVTCRSDANCALPHDGSIGCGDGCGC